MRVMANTMPEASSAAPSGTTLFVADYGGTITSLALAANGSTWSLNKTHETGARGPNPSWLTLDTNRGLLFCLNEGLETAQGSMSSFAISRNGGLTHIQSANTPSGPVSGVIYGSPAGQRALAVAHYSGSTVSTWHLSVNGEFSQGEEFTYELAQPGPNADRQDAPHEHEATTDPTGQYVLVPDLGADLVRVFAIDEATLRLKQLEPLQAISGSGPRHGVFWSPYGVAGEDSTSYYYLVGELDSTITGYAVEYLPNRGGLRFRQVYNTTTFGGQLNMPAGNAPAEIQVSPDNRFVIVSNRMDSLFTVPLKAGNKTQSDSLSTFALRENGTLNFVQLCPAGGRFPRHFSINGYGNLIAVGLQLDKTVVVMQRDVATGLIGEPVGRIEVAGDVTCVVWN